MKRLIALLALVIIFAQPSVGSAHSKLASSTPADGSKLAAAPSEVVLTFNDELESEGLKLSVTDANGAVVDTGDGRVDLADLERKTMRVSLKSGLGTGSYTVRWSVVGSDGHEVTGSIGFAVGDAAVPTPAEPDHHSPGLPATGSNGFNLGMLVAAIIIFMTAGVALRRRSVRA